MPEIVFEWRCPKCGATYNKCGRGECRARIQPCEGLLCECDVGADLGDDNDLELHGQVFSNPCKHATCQHCEWHGRLPQRIKRLADWEKRALDAGWSPPEARAQQLCQEALVKGK